MHIYINKRLLNLKQKLTKLHWNYTQQFSEFLSYFAQRAFEAQSLRREIAIVFSQLLLVGIRNAVVVGTLRHHGKHREVVQRHRRWGLPFQ